MAISEQTIKCIKVTKLKNLIDLELSFEGFPVTAILGPNGNGKSTVLHALACAFQPNEIGEDYKFSNFFLPHPEALWQGSEMEIIHSYRDGSNLHTDILRSYTKRSDRWTPKYDRRPKRDLFYLGIDKCVPLIESEKKQARMNYSTETIQEDIVNQILEKASIILNKNYSAFNIHDAGNGKKFIGVVANNLKYSALSMSAGEQKVFMVLEKIFKAKKYSLILIDELDLLLHDMALKKLIQIICNRATQKRLQVVFTTHRESVVDMPEINIRHIVCKPEKSLCFNETKPDAINRLTGEQPKPLEIFVEDDLASALVKQIASELRLNRFVSVERYGAAINCFTTVGGLLLGGELCNNSLFVLDGDKFKTDEEKEERIKAVLTGNDPAAIDKRLLAKQKIVQFLLPENYSPESYLHHLIVNLGQPESEDFKEIIEVSNDIVVAENGHSYINEAIQRLGFDRSEGLSKFVSLAAKSESWPIFTQSVREWLQEKSPSLIESELV
jgi:AAA15 family ATPase/GTPase